jgi:hypothetical protein
MSDKEKDSKKEKTETPKSEVKIERPQSVLIKNSKQIKKD